MFAPSSTLSARDHMFLATYPKQYTEPVSSDGSFFNKIRETVNNSQVRIR